MKKTTTIHARFQRLGNLIGKKEQLHIKGGADPNTCLCGWCHNEADIDLGFYRQCLNTKCRTGYFFSCEFLA
jgi:hypothetical protein